MRPRRGNIVVKMTGSIFVYLFVYSVSKILPRAKGRRDRINVHGRK